MCLHRLALRATVTLNPTLIFQTTMCFWKIYAMEKKYVMVMKMEGYGFLAEGATVGVWKWSDVACCPIAAVSLLVSCKSCYTNKHD